MSSNAIHQKRAEIMKEQAKLVKLEKELTKVLEKINQNLNVLKVDELELKSNIIQRNVEMKQTYRENANTSSNYCPDDADEINKQDMDLELIIKKFEEEDEDSD